MEGPLESTSSFMQDGTKSTSSHEGHATFIGQLKEMFPEVTIENMERALMVKGDLAGAIDYLLTEGNKDQNEDEDGTDWNVPLSAWRMRKWNYQEALAQFFTSPVQSNAPEEHLVISREKSVIAQVLRKYKNPSFKLQSPLNVQFLSSNALELGVDAGGPTTAYFFYLMQDLMRGSFNGIQLFQGEAGHLVPSVDYDLVSSCFFGIVGKMIVHSFLHQCRGLAGLSPAVISYIISGTRDTVLEYLVVDDVPDPCLREILNELVHCSDQELGKFTLDGDFNITDILVSAGFPHIEVTPSNRLLAYECVLTYEVITKRITVLNDLRKGLDSVHVMGTSVIDLLQRHSEVQQLVFPVAKSTTEVSELRLLLKYDPTDESTSKVAEFFEKYLDELSTRGMSGEEETLEGLLQFWTGWPSLPMLGDKMTVAYLPNYPNKVLAEADTCFKVIKIPTCHSDYKDFLKYMDISISHGKVGFGKM